MADIKKFAISGIEECGNGIKKFILRSPVGERLNFKPGQFANIYLPEGGGYAIFRPFSIASSPTADYLEFCIRIVGGLFTSGLDKLAAGTEVGIAGPFGHFVYNGQKECVFAVAGTGIAPIMSMLRYVNEKKIDGDFILLYSNKTREAILYYDELKRLRAENPCIRIVFTLTRETPEGWSGECGRIDEAMIEKHIQKRAANMQWYLCGPLEFVKAMKECALARGTPAANIKIEGWG